MGVSYNPKIVTDGLIGYWDAANKKSYPGSGTTWFDLTSNANHGTMSNVTFSQNAMSFNGTTSSVNCGNSDTLFSTSLTIDVLAYVNGWGATGVGRFVDRANNGSGMGYQFEPDSTTSGLIYGMNGTAGNNARVSNVVALGSWYSFSVTHTGTTAVFYRNGIYIGQGTLVALTAGTTNFYIGNRGDGTRGYDGKISSVKIYNRALSAEEIQQNFNAMRGRFGL